MWLEPQLMLALMLPCFVPVTVTLAVPQFMFGLSVWRSHPLQPCELRFPPLTSFSMPCFILLSRRSKAQQEPASQAVSTSALAPQRPTAGRHAAAAATATADSIPAAVPEAAPAAAAAGEALISLSRQVNTLTSAVPKAPAAVSPVSSTTPAFLVQLQEAVSRLVSQQQQQQQASAQADKAAQDAHSSTDAAAALAAQDADISSTDAAAALAALRILMGPDAMSLLPVLLVTAATAAAGLTLAAAMAGVAGLVDRRQGGVC